VLGATLRFYACHSTRAAMSAVSMTGLSLTDAPWYTLESVGIGVLARPVVAAYTANEVEARKDRGGDRKKDRTEIEGGMGGGGTPSDGYGGQRR